MNAKLIQDRLNEHGLVFRITDERIKQTTYEKSNDVVGVLEVMAGGYLYDETGNRVLTLQVEFVGANKDFNLFREIINDYFPNDELIGDVWVYSQPLAFTEFDDDEGHKKFNARVVFQAIEVVGGISGKSTTIKVDGAEIDFVRLTYRQDKTLMPFQAFGINKNVGLVNEIISLRIPMNENEKNIELIAAAVDNSYNKSYQIEWSFGGIKKTFDAVLRVGLVEYPKNHEPILFTITLERALPRETWGIAVCQKENYWDVNTLYKPANITYYEEITTEEDFRVMLGALLIDDVGYVVRNEYIEDKYWSNFNLIKRFKYVGLANGSEQHTLYMNADDDPLVWLASWENPNSYSTGTTFRVIDSQYGGSYRFTVEWFGSNVPTAVYDGYSTVIPENESQSMLAFAQNKVDTDFSGITQQGYIAAIKMENREFEFKGWTHNPFDAADDNFDDPIINSPATFMHALRTTKTPYGRPYGQRVGGTKDGTGRIYIAEVVPKNVWYFFQQEVDGFVFYGTLKGAGTYADSLEAPVIDYAAKHSVQTTTRWKDGRIVGKPLYHGNAFTVLFLIDEVTQQFIDDLYEQAGGKYKITYTIGSKTYTYQDLIVDNIDRQNTENANQVMQVTFAEGE